VAAAVAAATAPARATDQRWDSPPLVEGGDCPETLRLTAAVRSRILVAGPRLVLGAAGLAAARVAGAASGPALLAYLEYRASS
jgi:hypothetical protein